MGLDQFTRATASRNLRSLLERLKGSYAPVGRALDKAKWPIWGAVAGAPVLGYQLDRLAEEPTPIPEKNPELNEQREESVISPPIGAANKTAQAPEDEWLEVAAISVRNAITPPLDKQAAMDQLKMQITAAKMRARQMNVPAKPSASFLDGESQSLESGDNIAPVSNQPQYR